MNILLINPRYFEENYRYKVNKLSPPLGIALLASVLRINNQVVKIIDLEAMRATLGDQLGPISVFHPDVIGITGTSPIHRCIKECIQIARQHFPKAILIAGGPHATLFPESFFGSDFSVDYLFKGEAEYAIVEFTNQLGLYKTVKFPDKIQGLVYKTGGTLYVHPVTPRTQNLDSLPFPAYDLLPLEKYYESGSATKTITIMSSRGCPQRCIYCEDPILYGHKFRSRSAASITEEIKLLHERHDVKHIVFYDANFNASKTRVKDICKLLIEARLPISWRARVRADNLDRECLDLMKASGCTELSLGVESGSERVLAILKKRETKDKIRMAFNLIREAGLWSSGYFMFGAPGETRDDAEETIRFAIELDPDWALFSTATPLPGTEFLRMVKKSNDLLSSDLSEYKFNFDTPVVSYHNFTAAEICDCVNNAYEHFYLRKDWLLNRLSKAESHSQVLNIIDSFNYYRSKAEARTLKAKAAPMTGAKQSHA